jgi:hypothetical protein
MSEPEGGTPVEQNFASAEGRFRIGLPRGNEKAGNEKKEFTWFIMNAGQFHIRYSDHAHVLDTPEVSESYLKQLRDLIVSKRPNGQLEVDSAITLAGHPGREVRLRDDTGTQIDRIYLAGNRIYIVSVFVPKRLHCKLGSAVKVMDTFEITE